MILITGGAGFIGSNFAIEYIKKHSNKTIILDKLTYAGNINNLNYIDEKKLTLIKGDISDSSLISKILKNYKPDKVINFAAETHVDKSIVGPEKFIMTNIVGTYKLIDSINLYYQNLNQNKKKNFIFLHVSTDEVYGSLSKNAPPFTEDHKYFPNSPYSASKASSDHIVRSFYMTYGLPVIITNCSNNYGPHQFPEKLVPLTILNAVKLKKIPIYGDGENIRDWLYVKDHCDILDKILHQGKPGEYYNIGGDCEVKNIDLVMEICKILDELLPRKDKKYYKDLIHFVEDRAGHDFRYSINLTKVKKKFNWKPKESFRSGLLKTIEWYLNNLDWFKKEKNYEN